MSCLKDRQEYDAERHGNIFDFVVAESTRLRYWLNPDNTRQPKSPEPTLKSLRGSHGGHASLVEKLQKAGAYKSAEDVFEVAKARKL